MILKKKKDSGCRPRNITEEEEKYSLLLPRKQFGQGKTPRNGHSKLTDLGSSGVLPLSLCEMELLFRRRDRDGTDLKA